MNSTMWKIAPRTLARGEDYALRNVAGLARAITCSLTVALQSPTAARVHTVRALNYE